MSIKKFSEEGKILTFYSFKGGVGRTMALANVAYTAATNGYRVLVMDWDLEAPGLGYYFRGLIEAQEAKKLKETEGTLDLLWQWSNAIRSCKNQSDFNSVVSFFETDNPFVKLTTPLNPLHFNEFSGSLDFIGAGAKTVLTAEPTPYENALAQFSWSNFFDQEAGGFLLNCFRKWAKTNYDLILIDSRTGLADVAGICTMQIPDMVALCFILNRQNIDGVAKVSSAIRTAREDGIPVLAIPMRVTRSDTAEESDARARASTELTRIGGFSNETVTEDFRKFSIMASESVPFYETLAPFAAINPHLDLLSTNYLQLTTNILEKIHSRRLEKQLTIPAYNEEFLEQARRRLQPRHATVEYISKLRTADPARIASELHRLLEGALETEMDGGGLDENYLIELTNAAIEADDINGSMVDAASIQFQALDLLRIKASSSPDKWEPYLLSVIERILDEFSYLHDVDEDLLLLEEIDRLLATVPTHSNRLKRIRRRRQAARIFLTQGNSDAMMQTIGEIMTQLKDAHRSELANDQLFELFCAELDVAILRGDNARQKGNIRQALSEYERGIYGSPYLEPGLGKIEFGKLRSELHMKIATLLDSSIPLEKNSENALLAVRWGGSSTWISHFALLADIIMQDSAHPNLPLIFVEATINSQEKISQRNALTNYFGRQIRLTNVYLHTVTQLTHRIRSSSGTDLVRIKDSLSAIAQTSESILKNLLRRRQTLGDKQIAETSVLAGQLLMALRIENLELEAIDIFEDTYLKLASMTKDRSSNLRLPLE